MTWLGWLLSDFFDDYIRAVDHWVAFGLLVFIGIKMIIEACTAADECEVIDCDHFDFGRLLVLAVATSIDALAVGISLRVLQADILIPALIIGAVTAVFSIVGVSAGHRLKAFLGRKTEILGGIILIFIGIRILVTHLMS